MSHTQPTHCPRPLPSSVRRRGTALLHQQCWLWGQDIKRTEGNLLLQYGFDRVRPPGGTVGSTQYTLALACTNLVRLWGFGFYFGAAEGLYLNRYDFTPRAALSSDLWQSAQEMAGLPRAADLSLMASALHWISNYEAWVAASMGPPYRQTTLVGWKLRASSPALLVRAWSELAHEIQHCNRSDNVSADTQPCRSFPSKHTRFRLRAAPTLTLRHS